MSKSMYWNGISDVQISNDTKKGSKRIGIANIMSVLSAKSEGDVRVFKMCSGDKVGIKSKAWDEFMAIHDSERVRESIVLDSMPNL